MLGGFTIGAGYLGFTDTNGSVPPSTGPVPLRTISTRGGAPVLTTYGPTG